MITCRGLFSDKLNDRKSLNRRLAETLVLLTRQPDGTWGFPAGVRNDGEMMVKVRLAWLGPACQCKDNNASFVTGGRKALAGSSRRQCRCVVPRKQPHGILAECVLSRKTRRVRMLWREGESCFVHSVKPPSNISLGYTHTIGIFLSRGNPRWPSSPQQSTLQ